MSERWGAHHMQKLKETYSEEGPMWLKYLPKPLSKFLK